MANRIGNRVVAMVALLWVTTVSGVDLDDPSLNGFRILGHIMDGEAGSNVSGIGDVNGDGLGDIAIGLERASPGGVSQAGQIYVIFGKADEIDIDLDAPAGSGFLIEGFIEDARAGVVSGAGDVNGDGLADIVIGSEIAEPDGRQFAGEVYVVFGKADMATVSLGNLTGAGFRIMGSGLTVYDRFAGRSVSGAGDVNGDGLADLVIGADRWAYVVFGKASDSDIDLRALGFGGFEIGDAIDPPLRLGFSVSGVGDVNGDGLDDIAVGAPLAGVGNADGQAYMLHGKADPDQINLAELTPEQGFRLDPTPLQSGYGQSVSGAGDVNGDGYSDVIIGAPDSQTGVDAEAGHAYVAFGPDLLSHGFRMEGTGVGSQLGTSVVGLGDIDGDGLGDLLLGAPNRSVGGELEAGRGYLVPGTASEATVDLSMLESSSTLDGEYAGDHAGRVVSNAGDVNGDGLVDLIIAAPSANTLTAAGGIVYVVFSADDAVATEATFMATVGLAPALEPIGVVGNGSDEHSPGSRTWARYSGGQPALHSATLMRDLGVVGGLMPESVKGLWRHETARTGWPSVSLAFRYTACQANGLDETLLEIHQAASPVGPWTPRAASVEPDQNLISVNGLDALGYFALVSADVIRVGDFELQGAALACP